MKLTRDNDRKAEIAWTKVEEGWAVYTRDAELFISTSDEDTWCCVHTGEIVHDTNMIGELVEITEVKFR